MTVCQIVAQTYMGQCEGKFGEHFDQYDLNRWKEYCLWLLQEGHKKEPYSGFKIRRFLRWLDNFFGCSSTINGGIIWTKKMRRGKQKNYCQNKIMALYAPTVKQK